VIVAATSVNTAKAAILPAGRLIRRAYAWTMIRIRPVL
jgi:hypothetical protein